MIKKPHCYATVVIFLTISLQACADNLQCKHVRSVYGTMLKGHVIQESNVANILTCGQFCNSNIRCQSINYVISGHLCELNSRTKEARPEDYVQDADRVYLTRPSERGIELKMSVISVLRRDSSECRHLFVCLHLLCFLCFILFYVFLHTSNEAAKRELRRRHNLLYGVPLGQRTLFSVV